MFIRLFWPTALVALGGVLATDLRGKGCQPDRAEGGSPLRSAQSVSPLVEDYARADPEKLGVKPVPARKDPRTGFVTGGKNPTGLIPRLMEIAGRPVADLEEDMRPGGLSTAGFLGEGERLLEVLAADNRYVLDERGLTHQELARPLRILGAVAVQQAVREPREVTYHGRKFKVRATLSRVFVRSPFQDGTRTNCTVIVENLGNRKKLTYSLLVPQMIERYGFYEGKGTRYRVEPRAILEVFDFLKPAKVR
jgi:hypothetical protein